MFLRRQVREIFDHALSSVDPRQAVKQAINLDVFSARPIYAIAIGKAATLMATGLDEVLGEKLTAGLITASEPFHSGRWQSFIGGHPLPTQASLDAAKSAFALLEHANAEHAAVVFLISGGGSAMLEWPSSNEISLVDLREANEALVGCGASIAEINSVRRAFSGVKGGGLARRASSAQMFTLIVSDTNPGDEASVASGPTLAASPDAPNALEVVNQHHLDEVLPESILKAIKQAKESTEPVSGSHRVLLNNWTALEAAAKKAHEFGFTHAIAKDISEQPIQAGCDLLLSQLLEANGSFCLISGGEFSCPVRGDGRGGRNLETALRCAIRLDQEPGVKYQHVVILSAGTDGIDGNSPAAGAIADQTTITRARSLSLDADDFLARSDSYSFFERLKDLIVTGPTGTNVRDMRIFLRSS